LSASTKRDGAHSTEVFGASRRGHSPWHVEHLTGGTDTKCGYGHVLRKWNIVESFMLSTTFPKQLQVPLKSDPYFTLKNFQLWFKSSFTRPALQSPKVTVNWLMATWAHMCSSFHVVLITEYKCHLITTPTLIYSGSNRQLEPPMLYTLVLAISSGFYLM
jgi:hypothetical protein